MGRAKEKTIKIEEKAKRCDFCAEPVPESRGEDSLFCSDGCARSAKREEKAKKKESSRRWEEKKEALEIQPTKEIEVEDQRPYNADLQAKDYWRNIQKRWVDDQCFIEVRKWDDYDLSNWDGRADDPKWISVGPTREWNRLNPVQLEYAILNNNPSGGHFQVRVYKVSASMPSMILGPFFFHFTPKHPGKGGSMNEFLPLLDKERSEREKERDRLERAKEKAEGELSSQMHRLLEQQDRMVRRTDDENKILRQSILEKEERERDRQLAQQEMFFENQTRQFQSMQEAQSASMNQLTGQISQLFQGGGGLGGGNEATVGVIASMMQMMMSQTQQQQAYQAEQMKMEREQSRIDRQMQIEQMKMFATMFKPEGGGESSAKSEERFNRLEERYFNLLEAKNAPQQGQSKLESLFERAAYKQVEKAISGGIGGNEGEKDMWDKALDVAEKIGVSRIGEAVSQKILQPAPEVRELRESNSLPPGQPISRGGESMKPEDVTGIENLLVACTQAIQENVAPQVFAVSLRPEVRGEIKKYPKKALVSAAMGVNTPTLSTPRGRRWIEDTYDAL